MSFILSVLRKVSYPQKVCQLNIKYLNCNFYFIRMYWAKKKLKCVNGFFICYSVSIIFSRSTMIHVLEFQKVMEVNFNNSTGVSSPHVFDQTYQSSNIELFCDKDLKVVSILNLSVCILRKSIRRKRRYNKRAQRQLHHVSGYIFKFFRNYQKPTLTDLAFFSIFTPC